VTELRKKTEGRGWFLRSFPIVFAFLLPLLARQYLQAGISSFSLLLVVASVAGPALIHRIKGDAFSWMRYVSAIAAVLLAIAILVGILVTPLSAYIYWFDSFRNGVPQGGVATIFVLLITFFSSITSPLMLTMGVMWPVFILAVVVLYLLAVILQTDAYLYLLLAGLCVASIYYMVRRTRGGAGGGSPLFAVFLIVVTFVGASLFPRVHNPTGSNFVNKKIYPNLRKTVVQVFPRFPILYAVLGYGISFDEKKLGARPNLLDSPLLEIEGPPGEVLYLRTRAFDSYDGQSWSMTKYLSSQRLDSLMQRDFMAAKEEPEGEHLSLLVRARTFSYIPYTLDTKTIYFEDAYPSLKSGNIETGFELAKPFESGTKIRIERFPEGSMQVAPLAGPARSVYLQLPADLPPELRVIAEGLARDTETQPEVLGRIEAFLAQNYSYNLDVEEFYYEEGDDFAYSFLFQEEGGYCVHFATSFILLARLNGVPARYSTGYLAYIPGDGSAGTVSGLSSHAWPEVWLPDTGWTNWEATPAVNLSNYTTFGSEWFFNLGIDLNPATQRQLQGLLGQDIADQPVVAVAETREAIGVGRVFLIIGGIVFGLLLGLGAYHYAYPAIRYAANDRGRFYFSLRRLTRKLERRGIADPRRVGWLAWRNDVKNRIGSDGKQVDDMVGMLLRLTYGGESFKASHNSSMGSFRKYIHKMVLRRK
jgi:hypothetical protein